MIDELMIELPTISTLGMIYPLVGKHGWAIHTFPTNKERISQGQVRLEPIRSPIFRARAGKGGQGRARATIDVETSW